MSWMECVRQAYQTPVPCRPTLKCSLQQVRFPNVIGAKLRRPMSNMLMSTVRIFSPPLKIVQDLYIQLFNIVARWLFESFISHFWNPRQNGNDPQWLDSWSLESLWSWYESPDGRCLFSSCLLFQIRRCHCPRGSNYQLKTFQTPNCLYVLSYSKYANKRRV